jgi:hypothetical protein
MGHSAQHLSAAKGESSLAAMLQQISSSAAAQPSKPLELPANSLASPLGTPLATRLETPLGTPVGQATLDVFGRQGARALALERGGGVGGGGGPSELLGKRSSGGRSSLSASSAQLRPPSAQAAGSASAQPLPGGAVAKICSKNTKICSTNTAACGVEEEEQEEERTGNSGIAGIAGIGGQRRAAWGRATMEETVALQECGWRRRSVRVGGHYQYISPDGETFASMGAALSHAQRNAHERKGDREEV